MKIAVFTSNQSRHISLIHDLAEIADEVYAVIECNTVFPGEVEDFFCKTPVMQEYFKHVLTAQREVFGDIRFLPENTRALVIKSGDLNRLDLDILKLPLSADAIVVFGASFIKGALCERLVEKRAFNIHIGVSPYYRGNSCNFWALYDKKPEFVGATIHMLSKGLDSGDMLFHALPKADSAVDPFVFGMQAVKAAHKALVDKLASKKIFELSPVPQDKTYEIRYTRNSDFTDEVASEYLKDRITPEEISQRLKNHQGNLYLNPVYI